MWTLAINEAWILSETQFLHYPLGDWINDTHQIHKFVYCLDTSAIFETFTNGDIHEYRKVEHKTQNARNYVFYDKVPSLPSEFVPITVYKSNNTILTGEPRIEEVFNINPVPTSTWAQFLESQHPDVKYLLRYSPIPHDGTHIANAIRNRTAVAVTDASVEQRTGHAAISWIITDKQESFRCRGDAGCPKYHNALDSYGSESFGIMIVLKIISLVCDYHKIHTGKIAIACNITGLCSEYRAKVGDKYFDLLWAVFDARKQLKIKIQHKYVSGHQENKKKRLNLYERLNVECDTNSKLFRSKLADGTIEHCPTNFGTTHWSVTLGHCVLDTISKAVHRIISLALSSLIK